MQAPDEASERAPAAGWATRKELSEGAGKGRGLVATATSPTVANYAMTGVSGQENVLFLF
jgi:hypothetical protein